MSVCGTTCFKFAFGPVDDSLISFEFPTSGSDGVTSIFVPFLGSKPLQTNCFRQNVGF